MPLEPPAQKLVMLTGHDNQLAAVGGLLRADWSLPSFANDDTPPGGSMTFELRQDPAKNYIVRLYYTAQTMDQQHDATHLSLTTPPGIAPIFISQCQHQQRHLRYAVGHLQQRHGLAHQYRLHQLDIARLKPRAAPVSGPWCVPTLTLSSLITDEGQVADQSFN